MRLTKVDLGKLPITFPGGSLNLAAFSRKLMIPYTDPPPLYRLVFLSFCMLFPEETVKENDSLGETEGGEAPHKLRAIRFLYILLFS